jgi:glycosyltransferase involved in cell wall biosynthesis
MYSIKKCYRTNTSTYWSTPHRGLNILLPVFEELSKKYDTLELDVFSSFNLYGWPEKDKDYEELFDVCRNHPKINYHGTVDNTILREAIKDIHILAYPNTWEETSCITLLEAMSGGCLAVHPNYGALPETAANWTLQYQYDERPNNHAAVLHSCLDTAITEFWSDSVQSRIASAKPYTDLFYNWNHRINQWEAFLTSLLDEPRELPKKVYRFDSRG